MVSFFNEKEPLLPHSNISVRRASFTITTPGWPRAGAPPDVIGAERRIQQQKARLNPHRVSAVLRGNRGHTFALVPVIAEGYGKDGIDAEDGGIVGRAEERRNVEPRECGRLPGETRADVEFVFRLGPGFRIRPADELHFQADLQVFIADGVDQRLAEACFPLAFAARFEFLEDIQCPLVVPAELLAQQQTQLDGVGNALHSVAVVIRPAAVVIRPAVILADAKMILGKERRVKRKLAPIGQGIAALNGLRRDLRVIFLQDKVVLVGDLETIRQSQLKFLREKVPCFAVPGDSPRVIEIDIELIGRQHIDIGTRREPAASRPTGLVIRTDQLLARADPLHRHFRQHDRLRLLGQRRKRTTTQGHRK